MHSSISSSRAPHTLRTIAGTIVLFALMRCVFFVIADAFIAYPEAAFEQLFYATDLRCRMTAGAPQVMLQGTSRLVFMEDVPIDDRLRRADGGMMNVSIAGNTFWHMMALRRRNPELFARSELTVIDLLPMELYIGRNFNEDSALFFRESSIEEKVRIGSPFVRARALADVVVPAWSRRYRAETWWNALTHVRDTDSERLEAVVRVPADHFPEVVDWGNELDSVGQDQLDPLRLIARVVNPQGRLSRVQLHALRELVATTPAAGTLSLVHLPYRPDLDSVFDESPDSRARLSEFRDIVESVGGPRVIVRWYDSMEQFGLTEADYGADGLHLRRQGGIEVWKRDIARQYQESFAQVRPR